MAAFFPQWSNFEIKMTSKNRRCFKMCFTVNFSKCICLSQKTAAMKSGVPEYLNLQCKVSSSELLSDWVARAPALTLRGSMASALSSFFSFSVPDI